MDPKLKQKLQQMQSRAKNLTLFGSIGGRPLAETLLENAESTLTATAAEEKEYGERLGKLMQKAHRGDEDAQSELCGLVIERTNNYVIPALNFGRFFEIRVLGPEDNPAIKNETKQEIKVRYIGERGQNEVTKIQYPNQKLTFNWSILESDEVEYETFDLYEGDITDVAKAQFDLEFDMANQLEGKLDPVNGLLSTGIFGNFTVTGDKSTRVYNRNSRIRSDVLPTSNSLQIASISNNTTLGQSTLEQIVNYCARFARTSPDGDLMPTGEILVPADELIQVISGITLTATNQNAAAQQILQRGFFQLPELLGINWRLVPDHVIPKGTCYPVLNKPVGILWLKPSADQMDETIVRRKRTARRWMNKVIAAAIPTPNLRNIIKVQYHT